MRQHPANRYWLLAVVTAATALATSLLAACGGEGGAERACRLDTECASGVCLPSGRCAPVADDADADGVSTDVSADADVGTDANGTDASEADVVPEVAPDGTIVDAPDGEPDGDTPGCVPDHDGVITAAECPLRAGYQALFRVTTDVVGFDTQPDCADDACVWDLVTIEGTSEDRELDTLPVEDHWFADDPAFADATYASPLGEFSISMFLVDICRQQQLGVFQVTDDALLLLGVVSEREVDGTLLVYDPPLPFLRFPLEVGAGWTVDTTATGPLCNSIFDYEIDQTLEASVDATGDLVTPFGTFEGVLRVNSLLRRHLGIGVLPTVVRTHAFVAECFTTVATIQSEEGVEEAEFDRVAEVRRLTPFP